MAFKSPAQSHFFFATHKPEKQPKQQQIGVLPTGVGQLPGHEMKNEQKQMPMGTNYWTKLKRRLNPGY